MKKSSSLWRKCDALCSQVVRIRDGKCRICQNAGSESHHIVGRTYQGTTFLSENRLFLCRRCHNRSDLRTKCIEIIGMKEYNRLRRTAERITYLYESDLIVIWENLEAELKTLKEVL